MFCSFEKNPLILRLYGEAKMYHERDHVYQDNIKRFEENIGARQIVEMNVDMVQTSCRFAVPFMEFKSERSTLNEWADKKGRENIEQYWKDKNQKSIDGFETNILKS